jgi:hypothetical protein
MCAYRGTVVSQAGQAVDVRMDDPRIPGMSGIALQPGLPGATVEVFAGARVLVAWENGDPAKPVALLWDQGAHAGRVSLPADLLELGGEGVTEAVVLGSSYRAAEHAMNVGLLGLSSAMDLLFNACVGPTLVLKPGFAQAKAAIELFEARASTYLSTVVKTA